MSMLTLWIKILAFLLCRGRSLRPLPVHGSSRVTVWRMFHSHNGNSDIEQPFTSGLCILYNNNRSWLGCICSCMGKPCGVRGIPIIDRRTHGQIRTTFFCHIVSKIRTLSRKSRTPRSWQIYGIQIKPNDVGKWIWSLCFYSVTWIHKTCLFSIRFVLNGHLFNLIIVRLLNPIDIWSRWYFHY